MSAETAVIDDLEPEAPETSPAPESPTEDVAAPAEPTAPEATAEAPKLSALDRGKLRALGMGNLISRLETAEGQLAAALTQNQTLSAEVARLTAGREEIEKVAKAEIEAAASTREAAVSAEVIQTLSSLGVEIEDAPAAGVDDSKDPLVLLEKFEGLKGSERIAFFRAHKTALLKANAQ